MLHHVRNPFLCYRKKPSHAEVNCWFCNQNSVVPFGNRNCWDCPSCDQYNGFQEVSFKSTWLFSVSRNWNLQLFVFIFATAAKCFFPFHTIVFVYLSCFQNGDYNKPIPAQYMEHLNHGVSGSLPPTTNTQQSVTSQMLLCRKCIKNQAVVIKQLASFVPRDDVCTQFFSIHYNTAIIITINVYFRFKNGCRLCRRTTMRKSRRTSTTWSRPISCAGRVRQW